MAQLRIQFTPDSPRCLSLLSLISMINKPSHTPYLGAFMSFPLKFIFLFFHPATMPDIVFFIFNKFLNAFYLFRIKRVLMMKLQSVSPSMNTFETAVINWSPWFIQTPALLLYVSWAAIQHCIQLSIRGWGSLSWLAASRSTDQGYWKHTPWSWSLSDALLIGVEYELFQRPQRQSHTFIAWCCLIHFVNMIYDNEKQVSSYDWHGLHVCPVKFSPFYTMCCGRKSWCQTHLCREYVLRYFTHFLLQIWSYTL